MGKSITIARLNIAHFQRLLEAATDPRTHEMISRLLREEEAKLAALERRERKAT
jgi:hypothetical protein